MSATPAGLTRRALKRVVRRALDAAVPNAESGTHIDPATLPPLDPTERGAAFAALLASPEMESFRDGLRFGGGDVRTSVLRELSTFYEVSEDEALKRCVHWEEISLREWRLAEDLVASNTGHDTDDTVAAQARVAFYRTTQSWSFDLLWWAYVQAEGHADPVSVMALRWLQQRAPGRRHLDFGSGVGVTSQLFVERGWDSALADLSSTLLDFARFRLERRHLQADYIDLGRNGTLAAGAYDAITAIDTLAHVPDVYETGRQLCESLTVGGYLIANFDIREAVDITAWHLQSDELTARYDLLRAGFRKIDDLGYGLVAYQRTDLSGFAEIRRVTWLWLTHVSPFRTALRALAHPLVRAVHRRRRSAASAVWSATQPRSCSC